MAAGNEVRKQSRGVAAVLVLFLFAASSVVPSPALAWGETGHRAIAYAAQPLLSPAARKALDDLLGSGPEALADASIWADQVRRERRETGPWHYVNVPISSPGYVRSRDCPDGNCVVEKIPALLKTAADKTVARPLRVEALKFAIHLIGDLHQPLHVGDNQSRGGNEIWVVLRGRTQKLHAIWDSPLVEAISPDPRTLSRMLSADITHDTLKQWLPGSVQDWANEAHAAARDVAYPKGSGPNDRSHPIILSQDYERRSVLTVRRQLAKAAARLADLLNHAFER